MWIIIWCLAIVFYCSVFDRPLRYANLRMEHYRALKRNGYKPHRRCMLKEVVVLIAMLLTPCVIYLLLILLFRHITITKPLFILIVIFSGVVFGSAFHFFWILERKRIKEHRRLKRIGGHVEDEFFNWADGIVIFIMLVIAGGLYWAMWNLLTEYPI